VTRVRLPDTLLALPSPGGSWPGWLDRLPRLVDEVLDDWDQRVDGPPTHGRCSVVVPVRDPEGAPAALKVGWPHEDARHEHLALQHWQGDGAVRLLRADPHRWALLLERAGGPDGTADLGSLWDVQACEVAGELARRLHRPAPPQLRRLSVLVAGWCDRLAGLPRDAPVPRRLVQHAMSLGRELAADPATDGTLVHGDLHYANVLASEREPWLVIDPKPVSGDPHWEPAPLLSNRWDEVVASDVRWAVRRRLEAAVDGAGLDHDRARDWVVLRQVLDVLWCWEEARDRGTGLTAAEQEVITRAVTIAKAVQD
jgi:streptomycin 6-kinase